MLKKLKSYLKNDHIFYGLLIFMVGLVSFYCGRFSVIFDNNTEGELEDSLNKSEFLTEKTTKTETISSFVEVEGEGVVASKSGTKYHLPSCPGAKSIKSENLITFGSIAEAEAAGYKRAQNCP